MGRTPFYSKTDLLVSHELPMTGSQRLRFEVNVHQPLQPEDGAARLQLPERGAGSPRGSAAIDLHDVNLKRATTTER